jgi:anaerobic selenocysteine-containing dehydrogenase
MATVTTRYRACNLCEAICGLEIRIADGKVVSIRGDDADPLSRGHICPKAVALRDIQEDPSRLRHPVRRAGDRWEPVGWDEAFALVGEKLAEVQARHGGDAVAIYLGNPTVHHVGLAANIGALNAAIRTRNRFSASTVDQAPHALVCHWMYGHQYLVPIPDLDRTDHLVLVGANPLASNGSMMTSPDVAKRLQAIRARGKVVVVDPRRTETAQAADEHHFIRPSTDAAFLAAVLATIVEEGLARPGRLAPMLAGFDRALEAVRPWTAERAAAPTGIEAPAIRRIAREFAKAPRACFYGRVGISTQRHGTLCQWLVQLINIATGNLDRPGGSLATLPAIDITHPQASKPGSFGRAESRVRRLPEVNGEFPAAAMAEEMLTPGDGRIRALVSVAGNPVLSTPNGRQLDAALAGLEFMVAVDLYVNETTRHAHVILPTTTYLEHDHYDLAFNSMAVRNVARYNEALLPKPDAMLYDWEVMQRLAAAIGAAAGNPLRPMAPPAALVDFGVQNGPYGRSSPHGLTLAKLRAAEHGVDLGPLAASFPERLRTDDRRIHCAPEPCVAELAKLEDALSQEAEGLRLIGRRHVRSNNSWMHAYHRLVKGKPRHHLLMNPRDLARLGLVSGQRVRVRSRVGHVEVEVEASEDVMAGVVSLPHGWGQRAGVSANDLTDDRYLDRISGNAAVNGVKVTVETL